MKISEETHDDLFSIQEKILKHGTKKMPTEFQPIIESMKEKQITYKAIVGIAVKFLKTVLDKIED